MFFEVVSLTSVYDTFEFDQLHIGLSVKYRLSLFDILVDDLFQVKAQLDDDLSELVVLIVIFEPNYAEA